MFPLGWKQFSGLRSHGLWEWCWSLSPDRYSTCIPCGIMMAGGGAHWCIYGAQETARFKLYFGDWGFTLYQKLITGREMQLGLTEEPLTWNLCSVGF